MAQINVVAPELALGAQAIGRQSSEIAAAKSAIGTAEGEAGAFGGEPIAAAFTTMCSNASDSLEQYGDVLTQLSQNVALAALGYVNTDEGVIPVTTLSDPYGGQDGHNP
jgi:phage-related minor tail protein